ncbi:UPF0158 family protein [Nocardioides dilutus]
MLDLSALDLEAIGDALAQQDTYDLSWLVDPLPSPVWFQDMADFTDGITDERIARRLARALEGRKPFRRFKDELYGSEGGALIQVWHTFRDVRAQRRAVEWLLEQGLIDETAAQGFAGDHPDPPLP